MKGLCNCWYLWKQFDQNSQESSVETQKVCVSWLRVTQSWVLGSGHDNGRSSTGESITTLWSCAQHINMHSSHRNVNHIYSGDGVFPFSIKKKCLQLVVLVSTYICSSMHVLTTHTNTDLQGEEEVRSSMHCPLSLAPTPKPHIYCR